MALDRGSPIPLYYQLAEHIREQVRSGALRPGDQLPSERLLSEQHGISRMTARQAVIYLVREGVLVARHGLGTFVAEPKLTYDALHLLGFTEEIMRRGSTAASQVIAQRREEPPPRVAAELRLGAGEPVVKLVRLRRSDETPLLLETTYLPAARCPGLEQLDLASHSLYGLIEQRFGVRLSRARQRLEATVANAYEAQLLGVPAGTAMILLEGVTYDDRDRPVEYFKAVYRGDRVSFAFESERGASHAANGGARLSVVLA